MNSRTIIVIMDNGVLLISLLFISTVLRKVFLMCSWYPCVSAARFSSRSSWLLPFSGTVLFEVLLISMPFWTTVIIEVLLISLPFSRSLGFSIHVFLYFPDRHCRCRVQTEVYFFLGLALHVVVSYRRLLIGIAVAYNFFFSESALQRALRL